MNGPHPLLCDQAVALVIWASASAIGSLLSALAATCRGLVRRFTAQLASCVL